MDSTDLRRPRRWFWGLTILAIAAMGGVYRAAQSAPSPGTGLLLLVSGTVLAATSLQAARIWLALSGPPRRPRRARTERAAQRESRTRTGRPTR